MKIRYALTLAAALLGCHNTNRSHVDGGVLGRVVIYRNGVAFYERNATITDGHLVVHVPRDRVDDFLKSLTVIDRATKKPLSVTIPRKEADDGSVLAMTLETSDVQNAQVLMTYVTEAPAWKPSYRVVVGKDGKVMLEGWAVVDNTTSEDWKGVLVGVGASSALAFRYDLWSVRQIDRDLLQGEDRFAVAPPTGVSPYSDSSTGAEELAALDATEVAAGAKYAGGSSSDNTYVVEGVNGQGNAQAAAQPAGTMRGTVTDQRNGTKLAGVTVVVHGKTGDTSAITDDQGSYTVPNLPAGSYSVAFYYGESSQERSNITVATGKTTPVDGRISAAGRSEVIAIESRPPIVDQGATKPGTLAMKDYNRTVESKPVVDSKTAKSPVPATPAKPGEIGDAKLRAIASKVSTDKRDVVIEVRGLPDSEQDATARGNAVKTRLVDAGVPAARIRIVPKLRAGEQPSVHVLAVAPGAAPTATAATHAAGGDAPVGESHFMADRPMTVRAGTSAMVAMLHGETTGGVVYLYDPISDRGDKRFAFKAVRLDNPTTDTLEPGPVTVYGDGRFIGEGITEPVPPSASVVVPFALDKQIVVERHDSEQDRIAKLVTVQRGVITAEIQHRRDSKLTVTSRLAVPTTVYLRHRLESGWTLVDAPSKFTKVGDSQLFEVTLEPNETRSVSIAEATPVQRTLDLASEDALGMMQVFIDEPEATPLLKAQIQALLATHRGAADLEDKISTLRDQLGEYRSRSGELHAQIVTLKAVRTGGDLMSALRAKLVEITDRIQKATIELVDAQEKLMLARVKFQNQLADLHLTDVTKSVGAR